jgi:hypothetical protein
MLDQIARNPNAICFGLIMFIPLGIWFLSLMSWMISGDIEVITGIIGIFVAVMLAYLAVKPPADYFPPIIFFGMILLAVLLPVIRKSMSERELRMMEIEQLERHMTRLIERPDMTISRMEVARRLASLGFVAHALALTEQIKAAPMRQMEEEKREIRKWEFSLSPATSKIIPCLRCGKPGHPAALLCPHCQSPYISRYLKGHVVMPALAKKLIIGWTLGVGLLLAIPAASAMLPPAGSLLIIPMMLALGGYTAYRTFFAQPLDQF